MHLAPAATLAGSATAGTPLSPVERPFGFREFRGHRLLRRGGRRRSRAVPLFRGNPERIQTPRPRQAPAPLTLIVIHGQEILKGRAGKGPRSEEHTSELQ